MYHCHPGDNWRFYSDAGQALAYWSGYKMSNEHDVYPVKVVETFHIFPLKDTWIDFICVWERVNETEKSITISNDVLNKIGLLESAVRSKGMKTIKKC